MVALVGRVGVELVAGSAAQAQVVEALRARAKTVARKVEAWDSVEVVMAMATVAVVSEVEVVGEMAAVEEVEEEPVEELLEMESKVGRGREREVRVAAMEGAALSRTGRSSWNEDPAGRSQSPCSVPRTSSRRAQYQTSSPSGRASDSTLPPRQEW